MKKIITILVCISCIYMIVQPFRILFDGGQAISMLIPTLLIILYGKQFKNSSFVIATIYTIIVLLLRSIGVEYFETYLSQIVTMFFPICCMEHFFKTRDVFFAKSVLLTYFACFIFMSLISIPQFYFFPEMTRQLVLAEQEGSHVESVFYWSIAYPSMHEIPLLLIPLIALFKLSARKGVRIIALTSIVILILALTLGDATTPLLLSIVILFVGFNYNPKRHLSYNVKRLAFVSLFLAILLNKAIIISALTAVQPVFEGTTNYQKVGQAIDQIKSGGVEEKSSLGQRELVYNISAETFWSHPLGVEMSNDNVGMHSYIKDHLAVLGLILIIPLVLLTYQRYVRIVKCLNLYKFYFILSYTALIALAYVKNFFLKIDAWFIVPLFLLMLENNSKQNDNKKSACSENS